MDCKGKTIVLSAIFVLVGMMFVVPPITEKAMAGIKATAKGGCLEIGSIPAKVHPCKFTWVSQVLRKGSWVREPTKSGTLVTWETTGGGLGTEEGTVTYNVEGLGAAYLTFYNPVVGRNDCKVTIVPSAPTLIQKCHAGSGQNAEFTYDLSGAVGKK